MEHLIIPLILLKRNIGGPREKDSYFITDDCAYIKMNDGEVSVILNKQ